MQESAAFDDIRAVLEEPDIERKLDRAAGLAGNGPALSRALARAAPGALLSAIPPGRPKAWAVVPPFEVPPRPCLATREGRYQFLHAIANIELSAVELALLTAADFPGQPESFHLDWIEVAGEEVRHARRVMARLRDLGGEFGSEPVHLGLWDTARRYTALDERLAVVPRILEARGLDVSARLRTELARAGDTESVAALQEIYLDEIGHVARGTRWFRHTCAAHGVDPEERFLELLDRFRDGRKGRAPAIDRPGRRQAGFTERELDALAKST